MFLDPPVKISQEIDAPLDVADCIYPRSVRHASASPFSKKRAGVLILETSPI
jgi:hypothetical protein